MAIVRLLVVTAFCCVFGGGQLSGQEPEWSLMAGLGFMGLDNGIGPSLALGGEASWESVLLTGALNVAAPSGSGRYRWEESSFGGRRCTDTESQFRAGADDSLCPARSWGAMVDAAVVLPAEESFSFHFGGGVRAGSGITPYVLLGVELGIAEYFPVFVRTTAGLDFWQLHVGLVCCRSPILDTW